MARNKVEGRMTGTWISEIAQSTKVSGFTMGEATRYKQLLELRARMKFPKYRGKFHYGRFNKRGGKWGPTAIIWPVSSYARKPEMKAEADLVANMMRLPKKRGL